ncbi:hypothetical protein D3C81_1773750 [compost metagenome]
MAKDSNTYVSATNGEIRSDDKNVRLTVSNNGVPVANEAVAIWMNYSSYNFTTDANGQIQLKDKVSSTINTPVLFVLLKQGSDQYEAKPIYVTDLQQAGTYTVAIRYLDAGGKQLLNHNSTSSWPSGSVTRYGVSGIDVLVLRTGEVSGSYTSYITSGDGTYLFQTGQAALYS